LILGENYEDRKCGCEMWFEKEVVVQKTRALWGKAKKSGARLLA
jgi:hypothetical protein